MQSVRETAIPAFFGMIALAVLVIAVFHPIVDFEFVRLDVGGHVLENPHIRGLNWDNLKQIFTTRCPTSYYPVRSLTFALDYQIWGLNARGFKVTNILFHLTNAMLVFWLVLRLLPRRSPTTALSATWWDTCFATLSAALFAIHPVVVEPVTWVSGREELLMTLGALGCVHFHLTARRLADKGGKPRWVMTCHVLAALSCVAACLSNAVAAIIPLLIVALDALTLAKPTLRRVLVGTAALWAIGITTIVVKKLGEFNDPPNEVAAFSLERLTLILNAYWLNLRAIIRPTDLAIFYDPLDPAGFVDTEVLLGGLAVVLSCAVLWAFRRQKMVLFGLVWFALALGPSSQIMVHHIHRADRFLYLPLAGLAVAIAMGLRSLGSGLRRRRLTLAVVIVATLGLIPLGWLAGRQVNTWQNAASMWQNCVRVNPDNLGFRITLADCLASRSQYRRAVEQYEKTLESAPNHETALPKLAWLLASCPDKTLRDQQRALQLAERAYDQNPIFFHVLAEVRSQIAQSLAESGEFAKAVDGYRSAIELDPGNQRAMLELALLLATCHNEAFRNPTEAVELAERACLLNKQPGPRELGVLATAYAQAGQRELAVSTAEKAIEMARTGSDTKLIAKLRGQLQSWTESHRDHHVP